VSRRTLRLVVVPAILFAVVSGTVFVVAQLHPAKDEASSEPASAVGNAARGEQLFSENCATCHGEGGTGGGVGPTLAGSSVSLDEARSTIQNGRGVMPADLVSGQELEDVLAYLRTIVAGG
jgi:mono/diheme cytochrome c family protein